MQHYYHYHHIHCCDNWSTKYHHENTDVPLKLEKNRSLLSLMVNMVCRVHQQKNHKDVEGSTKNPRREFSKTAAAVAASTIFFPSHKLQELHFYCLLEALDGLAPFIPLSGA